MNGIGYDAGADLVGDAQSPVDRDRETLASGHPAHAIGQGRGHIDADHLTGTVDQRTTGVTGTDLSSNPDQVVQLPGATAGFIRGAYRCADLGHRARCVTGWGAGAVGVADGRDRIPDGQCGGRAQDRRRQPGGAPQPHQRDIAGTVEADHVHRVGAAIGQAHRRDVGRTLDDVVVGQHLTVGAQQDSGARSDRPLVTQRGVDIDESRHHLTQQDRLVQRCARRRDRRGGGRCGNHAGEQGQHSQHPGQTAQPTARRSWMGCAHTLNFA